MTTKIRHSIGRAAFRPALAALVVLGFGVSVISHGPAGPSPAEAACADTVLVRAAATYSIASGTTAVYNDTCTIAAVAGRRFMIEVLRPGGSPPNTLSWATVAYGGVEYFGTDDVDATGTLISRVVTPNGSDTLKVTLSGTAGAHLVVRVTQVPEALYQVYYTAAALTGGSTAKSYTRYFDLADGTPAAPHVLTLTNGAAGPSTSLRTNSTEVWLNSQQILFSGEVTPGRAFVTRDVTLQASNTLQVNLLGSQSGKRVTVQISATDATPPTLLVTEPTDSLVTRAAEVMATAQVADSQTAVRLSINGSQKPLSGGWWSGALSLPGVDGKTTFTFTAENGACLTTAQARTVIRDTHAPDLQVSWPDASRPSVPADSSGITVSGTWVDSTWTVVRVDGDTLASGYSGPSPRAFSRRVPLDLGPNRIVIEAFDAAGNADTLIRFAYRTPTEADAVRDTTKSALGVSTLSVTEATSFRSAIQFLYTGGSPVQTGLADATLRVGQEAVVSGRAFARDFGGLPNVTVNVLGHPELGSTRTRVDGSFDLVVNGGSPMTLRFRKSGFLEAQRDVDVPTQDYVVLDDVALIGQRSRADSVNTSGAAQAVVTRFESDANGDRKLMLFFAPATVCSVTTSSGTQAYSNYHVRVKEFTVGGDGDESMPAGLPPTTAYTYCVDLGVDEAAQQALGDDLPPIVTFNQPVVAYVKEFLGMPVGSSMPSGYYDQRRAQWVAGEDGTVVRITSISSGLANFDTNGDSVPDSLGQLAQLGITTAEREQAALLYAPGDSLWRMRIQHFSPHDFNLNVAMLASSGSRLHANAQSLAQLVGAPEATCGCVIENENRVLGETIPVQGTPYALHYRSNRQPGDIAMRTIRIPLVGSPMPPDLKRIRIRVDVAGRRYAYDLNYGEFAANDVFTFDGWDGCDRYGRPIIGSVAATVRVGLEFIAAYAKQTGTKYSYNGSADVAVGLGIPAQGERSLGRLIWTTQRVSLGAPSMASAGLGGWTISPHHFFDPNGRGTFWRGDGSFRYAYRQFPVVYRYAGNGLQDCDYCANAPAEGSEVVVGSGYVQSAIPRGLAIGLKDSLYYTERSRVLCISPDKHWHLVAGTASSGVTMSEGAMATNVQLGEPRGITVGPDGTVYFADRTLHRVFRVTPGGRIFTVAGSGSGTGTRQEDTLATAWPLARPIGVVLGRDGSIFVSDYDDHRILRVDTRGHIRTYAGRLDGTAPSGDHGVEGKAVGLGLATPDAIATDPDGNLYASEFLGSTADDVVWKIAPDGRRSIYSSGSLMGPSALAWGPDGQLWMGHDLGPSASNGVYRIGPEGGRTLIAGGFNAGDGFNSEDGQFATGVQFGSIGAIALDSRGRLFAGHVNTNHNTNGISVISSELPGTSPGQIIFPSEDGRERYIFDANGRHLRTEDAITGRRRYTFGYTSGQLTSITDANNQTTAIHRSGGAPLSIEAPLGQLTTLTLDATGQLLATVSNPNGEMHSLEYQAGGLLTKFTNPRQKPWNYAYSASDGRLLSDLDPVGGGNSLPLPTVTDTTLTVVRTTAVGRTTHYDVVQMLSGLRRRIVHRPELGSSYAESETDSMSVAVPYGEVVRSGGAAGEISVLRPQRDPTFGWLSPVPASRVTTLPRSQRTRTVAGTRSWSGAVFTETATVNGHAFTRAQDTAQKKLTLTTPSSRVSTVLVDTAGRLTKLTTGTLIDPVELGYDASGRLTHLSQRGRAWRYGYDGSGRLSSVTDTLGGVASYQYDLSDRVTQLSLPGSRVVLYRYDANGNLEGLTPPGGHEHAFAYTGADLNETYTPPTVSGIASPATQYGYNLDRQLVDVTRPDGAHVQLAYNSTTGQLGTLTQPRGQTTLTWPVTTGQLGSASSPDGVTSTYAYDGPLLVRETWSGAAAGAVSRTVNDDFAEATERVTVGTDSTSVVTRGYDNDGLLTSVAVAGATETVTRRTSDGLLEATSVTVSGHTVTSRLSYDNHGELWKLRYERDGGLLFEQVLGRDSLGAVTSLTESGLTPHEHDYRYDAARRLDQVKRDGSVRRSYVYDSGSPGNGNRTAEKDSAGATLASANYDEQDRMSSYGGAAYTWTDNGELARKVVATTDTTRYTYDALGNLTGAHLPSGDSLAYVIDAQDRRVGRVVNGTRTSTWLYANQLNIVAELDSTGALRNRFVYGTQGHVPDLLVRGGSVYRLLTDQLGSVRAVVKVSDGAMPQQLEYDAWGVESSNTDPAFQPLGFAGGLTDHATGLVRFGARDYEPGTGRWTAKDPIGFAGGTGLYAYASNQPSLRVDPYGLIPLDLPPDAAGQHLAESIDVSLVDPLAAFFDGMFPFADPLASAGIYQATPENGLCWSRAIGGWTLDAVLLVATARPKVWSLKDGSGAITLVDWGDFFRIEGHAIGQGSLNAFRWHIDAFWGSVRHWPWGL